MLKMESLLEKVESGKKVDITKIKEDAILRSCASNISLKKAREKHDKKTPARIRKVEQLAHIKFDTIEFVESEIAGKFTLDEVNYIIQSAFRRAELNHVHYKKKNKDGQITSMFNSIDRTDRKSRSGRYIDKFKLYQEYDNCFNEFYLQIFRMYKNNNKIFVFEANKKLERVKILICKFAFVALNCIEKAIYEKSYYDTTKIKKEREFLQNATSIDDTENFTDIPRNEYKYDYVVIAQDLRKMLTSSQREILRLKLKGRTTREIAEELSVSSKTIAKVLKIVKDYLLEKKTEIDYVNN